MSAGAATGQTRSECHDDSTEKGDAKPERITGTKMFFQSGGIHQAVISPPPYAAIQAPKKIPIRSITSHWILVLFPDKTQAIRYDFLK